METSSPLQDINDVDSVTVTSPDKDTLLVEVNARSRQGYGSYKKQHRSNNTVLRRPTKLNWSQLTQNQMRTKKIYICFMPCWKN